MTSLIITLEGSIGDAIYLVHPSAFNESGGPRDPWIRSATAATAFSTPEAAWAARDDALRAVADVSPDRNANLARRLRDARLVEVAAHDVGGALILNEQIVIIHST